MTTLQPIRMSPIGAREHIGDVAIMAASSTPRVPFQQLPPSQPSRIPEEQETRTPTRDSFAAANGKRSLTETTDGSDYQEDTSQEEKSDLRRHDSQLSNNSQSLQEIDMLGSDEGEDVSDNDSNDEQSERPSKKKKKGQRFFCTEYPPCNLSFTRSEHLARHIRKHTGERPFQCHCARRFSRLDNLRQHAQTVHVNEDIPGDSLAATGTRFQRQIRTDRVRPPGARSRASTAGSQGSHHRGHARNLSTSSIGSTTSNASTLSTMSDFVRDHSRPHSLNLSDRPSPRGGLTIDTMRASPQNPFSSYRQSPSGASTPTSYVYNNTPSSPFGSTLGSPISISRNHGPWGDKSMNRRLSVPSGISPFQTQQGGLQGPPYLNPLVPSNSSHTSSNNSSLASPTNSNYGFARDDAGSEADWRRRTWHPTTYTNHNQPRPATSGLSFSQTPDAPRPAFAPQALAAAGQAPRLPGFETFDQISQRPPSPTRQPGVAPQPDAPNRPPLYSSSSDRNIPSATERRGHASWDLSLHQNLTKLEIASGTPPKEPGQWGQQVMAEMQNAASSAPQHLMNQPQQPVQAPQPTHHVQQQSIQKAPSETNHYAQPPPPPIPPRARRQGWYNGGALNATQQMISGLRPSPEESSSSDGIRTPVTTSQEAQPVVIHGNGNGNVETQTIGIPSSASSKYPGQSIYNAFPAPPQSIPRASHSSRKPDVIALDAFPMPPQSVPRQAGPFRKPDTSGLDALVAVATSESRNQLPVTR